MSGMRSTDVAVIVPVKPARAAKSRLAADLDGEARARLVRAMLTDVLAAIRGAHDGPVLVVSSDGSYDAIVGRFDATRLPDRDAGYNAAVALALGSPEVAAAGAALVIPADQPRARAADVAAVIEAIATHEVVLVPALDGGTGALGLRPPGAITPAFGEESAASHRAAAAAAGGALAELEAESLRHDVDTIDDLMDRDPPPLGAETARFAAGLPSGVAGG